MSPYTPLRWNFLLMSCSCLPVLTQAAEKDEPALVIRQLEQVQTSYDRAKALSVQPADVGYRQERAQYDPTLCCHIHRLIAI